MAITYGFYNSLNGDRKYSADDFSAIFNGIINDGIFQSVGTAFVVNADEELNVTVGIGRAWFDGTWTLNDALLKLTAPESDLLYDRIDAVVIEINKLNRVNDIKFVQGEAKTNPVNPTLTRSTYVTQYPLCYIFRKANSTSITQANITNAVGSDETPFVTGILKTISLSTLLGQWEAELNEFVASEESEMGSWFYNKQIEFENWAALQQVEYDTWIETNENSFNTWFDNMQAVLNESVAANLQTQINANLLFSMDAASEDVIFNNDGSITEKLWLTNTNATEDPEWIRTTTFADETSIQMTLVRVADNYTVTKIISFSDTNIQGRSTKIF